MGIYSKYILPKVVHHACGLEPAMRQREKLVPQAAGRVLEIGVGSGLNLPYYDAQKVAHLWALDPSSEMWAMADKRARQVDFPLEFMPVSAETIPLDEGSVDTVLVTYSLCTIADLPAALAEIRRVLRSQGELLFCEHGMAPDVNVRRWQDRLNPLWKKLGGGCHLNRDIPSLLHGAGFQVHKLEMMYLPGWKPATFNYWGAAR